MVGYYDLVLGLIPVTLFGFSGVLYGAGFTLSTAVPVAALVAAGLVGHAMFVNAPIAQSTTSSASSSSAGSARSAPRAD